MKKALILACLPALVLLSGCAGGASLELPSLGLKDTDEEKITRLLSDVHRAMQTRKVNQIMAHVSPNYLDQEGRDYDGIREYLDNIVKNYRAIAIRRSAPNVIVEGDRARALEAFGTRAEPDNDRTPPLNIQGQVSVYLAHEDGKWKIVEWGPIS